jgi:6-phosphogluconate dehydrogenase (decarboxylating)
MRRLAGVVEPKGLRLIDAPVVFGAIGAQEGNLLSLCGGEASDVERARPVISATVAASSTSAHSAPDSWPRPATTCCTGFTAWQISKRWPSPSVTGWTRSECARSC